MQDYYTIGETAKLNNISVQTLRYYDRLGLFQPAHVDRNNGYRFYDSRQFFYLDIIKSLKYLQTPLEDIKRIIEYSPENMLLFLHNQEKAIEKEKERLLQAEQLLYKRKRQLAEQFEISKRSEDNVIYSRDIEEQKVLKMAITDGNPNTEPNILTRKLAEILEGNSSMIDNQCGYIYDLKAYQTTNQIYYEYVYSTLPHSTVELSGEDREIEWGVIASGEYICIAFDWSLQHYLSYYQKLYDYIKVNNIRTEGKVYEVSIPLNYSASKEDCFVTELRVKKLAT
ncbi:transcriptional regulator [Gracilibacillus orientalis]|uniref:Transcriptional regulator n=1 Tax=Gracilibacillus orientalis TaxID=334253 RepID=A0A1I4J4H2_9BACI|nr:MerR family transcriptional regulator [Gracilibacillus orientalis]SFL61031.1 transcriptional regulator [Gracilibacillus orientalis]